MDLYAVDTESYFVKDIKIINNQLSFSVYIPRSDMSITNFSYYFSDKSIYIRLKCCHVCLCDLTNGELRVSINLPEGFTYKLYKKGRSNCDIQLIDEIAL